MLKKLWWVALIPPIALLLVLAGGSFYLRFVPFEIPAELRPPASATGVLLSGNGGLHLKYLGISGYRVTDRKTTLLLDPVLTRPKMWRLLGPIDTDPSLIKDIGHADYILVNHGHYDHAMDAPAIALKTGATVIGSRSVVNLARSRGVPASQTLEVFEGDRLTLGTFEVVVGKTDHSPLMGLENPMAGVIPTDAGSLWFFQYLQDATFTFHLRGGGTSLVWHASSAYGPPAGLTASTVIFGWAGTSFDETTARSIVDNLQPKRLLPTHWDNFFHPRELGPGWLPVVNYETSLGAIQTVAPDLPVWFLTYDETVYLPPD